MSYVPVASSDDLQSSSLFEGMPKTGNLVGAYESAANVLTTTPFADLAYSLNSSERRGGGKYLSPDDIKTKYPQAYKKYKSGGGYEDQVAYDDKVISEHNYRSDLVQNMKPGFLSAASKFAGSAVGMMLSPTTIATGMITGGVGAFAEDLAMGSEAFTKLMATDKWARRLYKAQSGALEVGLIMQPTTVGEDVYRKYAGDKNVHMLSDMGHSFIQGALAGMTIKTVFGHIPTMDKYHAQISVETASRQLEAGEKIDVAPILKQGHYEASKTWTHSPEEIQEEIDKTKPKEEKLAVKQAEIESKIEDHKGALSEAILHDKATEVDSYKNFIENNDLVDSVKMKKLYKSSSKLSKALDDVKGKRAELQDIISNTEAYKQMVINKPVPLDSGELAGSVAKINKPENGITFDTTEEEKSQSLLNDNSSVFQKDNMTDDDFSKLLEAKNNELDGIIKNVKLSNEAQTLIDEAEFEGKDADRLDKARNEYNKCMGGV